jgi:zinc transport system substrate-binding protein
MTRRAGAVLVAAALVAGLLAGLTGCRLPSTSGRPTVVAGFYPLYFVADRIAGRYNHVVELTPPGVEPHEYELTVRQVAQVDLARVGIYEQGLAPSVDQAMENDSPDHRLDITSVVPLSSASGSVEATSQQKDPHFWLDPTLLARVAQAFADTMAEADPAHASYYRAQGQRLVGDLQALDREYAAGLASCRTRTVVVSHDAFEYLGRRYHLDVVPIAGIEPDAEPSISRLHDLSSLVRERGVSTIFFETLASPDLAQSLASDAGLGTAVLDPIEGLSSADPNATYLTLMRQNLTALTKANECS